MLFRYLLAAGFWAALFLSGSPAARANDLTTADAVARLFQSEPQASWFSADFLAAVPLTEIAKLIEGMKSAHGEFVSVEGTGDRLTVALESAEVPTQIALDAAGRIAGLFFASPEATGGSIDDHISAITALPGNTAVIVLSDGAVIAEHNADAALAVGSTLKLAVLSALRKAYTDGTLSPETVVALDDGWKSLPSGVMQDWPAGTPVTIATLATQMISISDNTATDAPISIVGREAVSALIPRNTPVLTTSEIFRLNAPANSVLLAEWQDADEDGKRAVLEKLSALPLPTPSDLTNAPATAEWFMSVREACALLNDVAEDPAFIVNPGLARRDDWKQIAFKGGSDNGVLNFTTRVVDDAGKAHCLSATWNNEATLEMQKLSAPYAGILRSLRAGNAAD